MARSLGGGGSSGGGGRSLGGGGRSSRSFSGSGRSYSGGSTRRTSSSSSHSSYSGSSSYSRPSGRRPSSGYSRPRPNYGGGLLGAGIGYMLGSSSGSRGYSSGYRRPARRSYGGGGCASVIGYFVVIVIALSILSYFGRFGLNSISGNSSDDSANAKLNKTKYTGEVYTAKGYYEDHSSGEKWIDSSNERTLISGMKSFYQRTGVFPFLYIVDSVPGGGSEANIGAYEDNLYAELFSDRSGDVIEGNLLILFVSDMEDYFLVGGLNTGEVIDASATKVITDKINARWSNGDLAYIFGDGLDAASVSIMAKSNARVIAIAVLIVAGAVGIVFISFKWWKARVAQKNKEQEDLEKILSKPLDTFGNQEITDLQKKYQDQKNSMQR